MSETNEQRCRDAEGVLPLELVLAQEHDRIHGDDVTSRIAAMRVSFDVEHVIAPAAFAHRLLRAQQTMASTGARQSRAIVASRLVAEDAPLDSVAIYVLGSITELHSAAIAKALEASAKARTDFESHPNRAGTAETAATEILAADALLVRAILPHLNYLLDQPIEVEPAFASFIAAGAIDALGGHDSNTDQRLRRQLLEAAFDGQLSRLRDVRLDAVYAAVRQHDTAALCLSGGGIRSATFAVGVIRGLAHYGLLSKFDYLSTVSGGGYAGSWLSAWMHHTSATEVHAELKRGSREKLAPEPAPMQHLRAYSHFLTPRAGMFSTDTWTLIATIGRNLLLNWLVLIPLMAAAVLLPRYCVAVLRVDYHEIPLPAPGIFARPFLLFLFALGLGLGTWAARFVHLNRPDDGALLDAHRRAEGSQHKFVTNCFVPLVAAAVSLTTGLYLWWTWSREMPALENLLLLAAPDQSNAPITSRMIHINPISGTLRAHPGLVVMFIASGAAMHVGGWLLAGRFRRHPREFFSTLISGVTAGTVGLLMAVWFLSQPDTPNREMLYVTLAPSAFLTVMLVGSQLFTALTSFSSGDDEREWVTRFNAWLLIAIASWSAACALVLYGPMAVTGLWQQLTVAAVGGGSGLIGVLVARSSMNARPGTSSGLVVVAQRIALALAAPLFATSIIIALAALNETLISSACGLPVGADVFDCRLKQPRADDYSHSQPFVVLARHQTEKVDSLASLLSASEPDPRLLNVFTEGDALARALAANGDRTDASWSTLLTTLAAHADSATRSGLETDSLLRTRIAEFTEAVIATDSTSLHGIGGDSILRSLFLHRALAEERADAALHARRVWRDSGAVVLDHQLVNIEALWNAARVAGNDSARPHALGVLHDRLDERLRSSIVTFDHIAADSARREASHLAIVDSVRRTGQLIPYDGAVPLTILILFALLIGLGLVLGAHIDTNKFSLRAMYEMRLVRAYLGASRPACDRKPNLFTGFDPRDDFPMGALWPAMGATPQKGGRPLSCPPMHVVNVTLNLVAGTNLAWQQRKSESMTITPLHAGSAFIGYRPTTLSTVPHGGRSSKGELYGGKDGVTLGTAVTISGAAASPNAGSHSSPMITFLMTFFNARLGAWLGNPGRAGATSFDRGAPSQKIKPILDEMFGLTSDKSPYVYLSDGGHFENLALYEMVMRRCRFIVVSDAGCDPNASFDDLGNAVRKIRVDLGVPIEFPDGVHVFSRERAPTDGTGQYWAVGHIKYSAVDGAGADPSLVDGLLIYLKPSLYGKEPSDVQQYSRTSEDFPHESTSDQFFSESQFESYRALGEFIVRTLVDSNLASPHINVKGVRTDSLLANWSELLKASDSNVRIPSSESGVWPTSVEKHTV